MTDPLYISALAFGFLGSFHCAGMCGPITLLLPDNVSKSQLIITRALYNGGRIFTYILLGFIVGLFGLSAAINGFQKELSIILGLFLIVIAVFQFRPFFQFFRIDLYYSDTIRNILKKAYSKKTYLSMITIGIINGLLPCGFLLYAVAGAAATTTVEGGIAYMALFGLGTLPVMATISLGTRYFNFRFNKWKNWLMPVITIALGIFLIYRGTTISQENCAHPKSHTAVYCKG